MNKDRRKTIEELIDRLDTLMAEVDTVASEERDYYDAMPEGLQNGDKGQAASDAADALERARDDIDTAKDALLEAIQ